MSSYLAKGFPIAVSPSATRDAFYPRPVADRQRICDGKNLQRAWWLLVRLLVGGFWLLPLQGRRFVLLWLLLCATAGTDACPSANPASNAQRQCYAVLPRAKRLDVQQFHVGR